MPRTLEEQARLLQSYERKMLRIIRRGDQLTLTDLRRISSRFDEYRRSAIAAVSSHGYELNRAATLRIVSDIGERIDQLARDLGQIVRDGMTQQQRLSRQLAGTYAEHFIPEPGALSTLGQSAQAVDLAASYSADLIALREGGIAGNMLAEVNGVVQRAALGLAADTSFNAIGKIMEVFRADNVRKWRWAAERIYRTETLRIHSLLTEQSIRDLNKYSPTSKRWMWSGISRREHQTIHNQTVGPQGRFTVPLKDGGSVRMRFPRDPSAPASATINCGCYVVPVPRQAARVVEPGPPLGRPARRAPARRRTPAGRRKNVPLKGLVTKEQLAWEVVQRGYVQDVRFTGRGFSATKTWHELLPEEQLRHMRAIAEEWERLWEKWPGLRKASNSLDVMQAKNLDGSGVFGCAKSSTGQFAVGHVAAYAGRYKRYLAINQKWSTSLWAETVEGKIKATFRHELGHIFQQDKGVVDWNWQGWRWRPSAEFDEVLREASGLKGSWTGAQQEWVMKNISEYAGTNPAECWAEIFSTVTEDGYVKGTLPKVIEDYVERKIGGPL